jgi:predicted transcriptional regulator
VQVLEALSKHGLTLQNFSSIQEQQMGGWTQARAPQTIRTFFSSFPAIGGVGSSKTYTLNQLSSSADVGYGTYETQVAAHGTGATLPTVEEQITSMTLIVPAL